MNNNTQTKLKKLKVQLEKAEKLLENIYGNEFRFYYFMDENSAYAQTFSDMAHDFKDLLIRQLEDDMSLDMRKIYRKKINNNNKNNTRRNRSRRTTPNSLRYTQNNALSQQF